MHGFCFFKLFLMVGKELSNEGIVLNVGVCMGGCISLGTWLQLQGLRGVGRGSSTCGTSGFTTHAAETKDM